MTGAPVPGAPADAGPLRIVVADDQASVREGLVAMLGLLPDITVVGAAADGAEALRVVERTRPQAILLDLRMPVLDGIETTRRLAERYPEVAVVVLTTYDDDSSVLAALRAGARSYLTKDARRAEIAQALRGAVSGLAVLDPGVQATLLAAADPPRPAAPRCDLPDGLTQREAEILAMIARGLANPQIAAKLVLSSHTIKSHVNRIFAKTGSADREAAIRYARRHGLG
ncbi:MAG TPA: response regulator transcription factor [Streptosporangiaceae bacterium]|nr:response regulator transcription factor [Streptosporangiaceae bacterium]